MILKDRYFVISLLLFLVATIESVGGLLGLWSVIGEERLVILSIEGAVLIGLLVNCYAIKNWVYHHSTESSHRLLAWTTLVSIALCICGDVVNFNLPLSYYRYDDIIKHDYLVDSVFFFGPGYALFLMVTCCIILSNGLKPKILLVVLSIASLIGATSFMSMHLSNTGLTVSLITGAYAVLITLVGASGIILFVTLRKSTARVALFIVASGLVLATIADGVIGQFWIYGNNGEGYYPIAKYINWSLYIASQSILIHLARIAVWHKNGVYKPLVMSMK
jgi:hypothetical protein